MDREDGLIRDTAFLGAVLFGFHTRADGLSCGDEHDYRTSVVKV